MGDMKPCPHCGCDIVDLETDHTVFAGCDFGERYPEPVRRQRHGHRARCGRCGCQTCWWHYKSEAVDAWNARAELERQEPNGWYCEHCQRGVDPSEVTYHEAHEACGRIITNDAPPPAPSVPDGWKLWRDEDGDLRLDDLKRDLHLNIPAEHVEKGDLFFKVIGGLLDAMLTATPAPPTTKQAAHPEWRDHVPSVTTDTAGNAAPPRSESVVKAEALTEQGRILAAKAEDNCILGGRLVHGLDAAARMLFHEAARLRSEGRE